MWHRARLEVAEAWDARAAEVLERHGDGLPEDERPTMDALHRLAAEGYSLSASRLLQCVPVGGGCL
jgi:hypothetical protein